MKFSDLNIHPALASALVARGYDNPTGVQAAVLEPACVGRDLLISSQTGSGKTIAFGVAMADNLLGREDTEVPRGPKPIALVIVPTRELATQVREELRWLYAPAKPRLASFTGGTPVRGDLDALKRGVELAIGTPGRLVDLIRRERLQLGDVRVVVLDEADEMLDLGFREDLEAILQAAPPTRRTLLLSATLPPEIRALARRYQRDALAIDPRKNAAGEGAANKRAHDDITHRGHLIAGGDRLAAVVNVLRAENSPRAIVFCTTREAVSELQAALTARGFATTAISGDRAQSERDRALNQLRSGDARVLVATNVAARGLHLPDVDLIVHADLPLNADSLIHRSGRTGRAGRKGTSVVIATAAERRKAERLLAAAHVTVKWTPAPSAATIAAAARARLAEELLAAEPSAESTEEAADLLARVAEKAPERELLLRVLARELSRLPNGEPLKPISIDSPPLASNRHSEAAPGRRPLSDFAHGVVFRVNLGAKDQADPRWVLPLICRRGGITRREVGAIRIGPAETQFEIAGDAAADFALAAAERDPRAPHVVIQRADAHQGHRPPQRHSPRPPQVKTVNTERADVHQGHRPPQRHGPRPPQIKTVKAVKTVKTDRADANQGHRPLQRSRPRPQESHASQALRPSHAPRPYQKPRPSHAPRPYHAPPKDKRGKER